MTIHLDWLKTGRAPRGTPRRGGAPRRLLALGLIAGLALIQAGCTSGPFSNCGSCNSCGFFRRATSRVFNRPAGCCGSSVVGDSAGVEYSAPSTIVGPATTAAPQYSPSPGTGTIVVPSNGGSTEAPTNLERIPSARPGTAPGTSSTSGSGAGRTSYYTRQSATKTAVRLDSGLATERASISRPAQDSNQGATSDPASGDDDNPLDHLPPLGLPGEVTQSAAASPTPPAARPEGKTGDVPVSAAPARSSDSTAEDGVSLLAADTTAEPDAGAGAGNGIARFAPVDPKLAGGSLPSAAGLGWLAEKGYRTVLDLRPSGEVSPAFIAEAATRGLRYVALPVSLEKLDPDRLARFQFELAAPEARPLFFFDGDGSRAGALWYIRRVTVDRVDRQLARREAEEIGLKDQAAWQLTTTYLDRLDAAKAHPAPTRTGAADPPASPTAAPATPAQSTPPRTTDPAQAPETPPAAGPLMTSDAPVDRPNPIVPPLIATPKTASTPEPAGTPGGSFALREVVSWRPLAAMLLTGLSLPLAYWTRTAIPEAIARARASLPGPGPRPRSLPHESGE
jgi:protein tyrosine phosphatase (PTP) superfamily phosphohydrolase (DUF442 family)